MLHHRSVKSKFACLMDLQLQRKLGLRATPSPVWDSRHATPVKHDERRGKGDVEAVHTVPRSAFHLAPVAHNGKARAGSTSVQSAGVTGAAATGSRASRAPAGNDTRRGSAVATTTTSSGVWVVGLLWSHVQGRGCVGTWWQAVCSCVCS